MAENLYTCHCCLKLADHSVLNIPNLHMKERSEFYSISELNRSRILVVQMCNDMFFKMRKKLAKGSVSKDHTDTLLLCDPSVLSTQSNRTTLKEEDNAVIICRKNGIRKTTQL